MTIDDRLPKCIPIVNQVAHKQRAHLFPKGCSRTKSLSRFLKRNAGEFLDLINQKRQQQ